MHIASAPSGSSAPIQQVNAYLPDKRSGHRKHIVAANYDGRPIFGLIEGGAMNYACSADRILP